MEVPYPTLEEEVGILHAHHLSNRGDLLADVGPVLTAGEVVALQEIIRGLHVEDRLIRFIAGIVTATRDDRSIALGASPRASIALLNASKAIAGMRGRDFVTPEDILFVALPVLRHRITLIPEREMEGVTTDEVIRQLLSSREIPR